MTGRALRSIRLALSLTIDEFSERIGIPALELEAFERGNQAIDEQRLSIALERLTPEVATLACADPLFGVLPLRPAKHAAH